MSLVSRAAIAVALLVAVSRCEADPAPPKNFGVVVTGGIYRGGQPTSAQIEYLHTIGVRTILKLNEHRFDEEREAAERFEMKLVSIPLDASNVGKPKTCNDVAAALAVLADRSQWPVYVHCSLGRDRAGYIVGAFRELVEQWPWARVDEELARYGHGASMRRAYPQIHRELERQLPACSAAVARALSPPKPAQ